MPQFADQQVRSRPQFGRQSDRPRDDALRWRGHCACIPSGRLGCMTDWNKRRRALAQARHTWDG